MLFQSLHNRYCYNVQMRSEEYRDYIIQQYKEKAKEIDIYRRDYLELYKRQIQLTIDWTTILCTLCFAIGAAVIPLISQFSGQYQIKHPSLLLAAALILIINGTVIMIIRKHHIQEEYRQVNIITIPYKISLVKTHTVLGDFVEGTVAKDSVDKRLNEQLSEATKLSKRKRKKEKASYELDAYLGVMLAGIITLFGSIISDRKTIKMFIVIVSIATLAFVWYAHLSHQKVEANINEKELLNKSLKDASKYKVKIP